MWILRFRGSDDAVQFSIPFGTREEALSFLDDKQKDISEYYEGEITFCLESR